MAVTQDDIERGLRALGLGEQSHVLVHSAFKAFGGVEGGPIAVAMTDPVEDGDRVGRLQLAQISTGIPVFSVTRSMIWVMRVFVIALPLSLCLPGLAI